IAQQGKKKLPGRPKTITGRKINVELMDNKQRDNYQRGHATEECSPSFFPCSDDEKNSPQDTGGRPEKHCRSMLKQQIRQDYEFCLISGVKHRANVCEKTCS